MLTLIVSLLLITPIRTDRINELIKARLDDAVLDVLKRSTNGAHPMDQVPRITQPERLFMHSYVPRTGVGNREDIEITEIKQLPPPPLRFLSKPKALKFLRFNSTNFVLSEQQQHLNLYQLAPVTGFELRSDPICSVSVQFEGEIIGAHLYIEHRQSEQYHESLRIAAILRTVSQGHQIRIYELSVSGSGCAPVTMIELARNIAPVRLRYIESRHESAIVVLSAGRIHGDPRVDFSRLGQSRLVNIILSDPIDLETFTINGYSFVAIASEKRGVEIFRMNEFLHSTLAFDRLDIEHVTDLEFFRMGFDFYLAVATSGSNQFLFEFKEGAFHLKQRLDIYRVLEITHIRIPSCREDVLVQLIRDDRQMPRLILSWTASSRTFDPVNSPISNHRTLPRSGLSVPGNNSAYIMELDSALGLRLFVLRTQLTPIPDPVYTHAQQVSALMQNVLERLRFQQAFMQRIHQQLDFAVTPKLLSESGPLVAPLSFRSLQGTVRSVLKNLRGLKQLSMQGSRIGLADLAHRIEDLGRQLQSVQGSVSQLDRELSSSVAYRDKPVRFPNQIRFESLVEIGSVSANTSIIDNVRRNRVSPILDQLYLRSNPKQIRGRKTVDSVSVRRNLHSEQVNGLKLDRDAMVSDRPQVLRSPIQLVSPLRADQAQLERINDIDIRSELVRTDRGQYHLKSPIHFRSAAPLSVHDLTADSIDSVRLEHLRQGLLLSDPITQQCRAPLIFLGKVVSGSVVRNERINGLDIRSVTENLVRVDRPGSVSGLKRFVGGPTPLQMKAPLQVSDRINSLRVPTDILTANEPQLITAPKRFLAPAGIRFDQNVSVSGRVDGLRLPLDIVTLSGSDPLPPNLQFNQGIDVFGNLSLSIGALVNGVSISGLNQRALRATDQRLRKAHFSGPVHVQADLLVNGLTNGIKLSSVAADAIMKNRGPGPNAPTLDITGRKTLKSISAPELRLSQINDVSVQQLIRIDGSDPSSDQLPITSRVQFRAPISVGKLHVGSGRIGAVDVSELYNNRISLTRPGLISSRKNFLDELRIRGTARIDGRINGIIPQIDLVLRSTRRVQKINGAKRIRSEAPVQFQSVRIDGNLDTTEALINGALNVTDLYRRRITLHTDQIVKDPLQLIGSRVNDLQATRVNDEDLRKYLSEILYKSGPQTIYGNFSISGYSTAAQVETNGASLVNNISLNRLRSEAINIRAPLTVITAPKEFMSGLRIGADLQIGASISGVDLSRLARDSVKTSGPQFILAPIHFAPNVSLTINGQLNSDRINSAHLPSSIMLRSANQQIRGKFSATGRVRLNGASNFVAGNTNGLRLQKFYDEHWLTDRSSEIRGSLTFADSIHVIGDINARSVNSVDLRKLASDTLYKHSDQRITEQTVMENPVRFLKALNAPMVNNLSIKRHLDDIVWINRIYPVRINGEMLFKAPVKVIGNLRSGNQTSTTVGPYGIDSVNLMELDQNHIPLHSSPRSRGREEIISANKKFRDNVHVESGAIQLNGLINGLNLSDALRTDVPNGEIQVIRGKRQLLDVLFNENVDVNGLVNRRRLPALALDSLYRIREQKVHGAKYFKGRLELQSALDCDTFNNVSDPQNRIWTNQKSPAPIVVTGKVQIQSPKQLRSKRIIVDGLIDGVNFTDLVKFSLKRSGNQSLPNPIRFDQLWLDAPLRLEGRLNGLDIRELDREVRSFHQTWQTNNQLINEVLSRQIRSTDLNSQIIRTAPVRVDHFKVLQEIPGAFGSVIEQISAESWSLIDLNPNSIGANFSSIRSITVLRWSGSEKRFNPQSVAADLRQGNHKFIRKQALRFRFGPEGQAEQFRLELLNGELRIWRIRGIEEIGSESWSLRAPGARTVQPIWTGEKLLIVIGTDQKENCIGSIVFEADIRGSSLLPIEFRSD